MHKDLINNATDNQLREFIKDAMSMIKETNQELYKSLEMALYTEIYGCHFSEWLLNEALSKMQNEDGTIGGHWAIEQTTQMAKTNGITFTHFNEYDWNYVMNMIYSDYYGAIPNETSSYLKIARKFIEDKDAPKGKAFKYYMGLK